MLAPGAGARPGLRTGRVLPARADEGARPRVAVSLDLVDESPEVSISVSRPIDTRLC